MSRSITGNRVSNEASRNSTPSKPAKPHDYPTATTSPAVVKQATGSTPTSNRVSCPQADTRGAQHTAASRAVSTNNGQQTGGSTYTRTNSGNGTSTRTNSGNGTETRANGANAASQGTLSSDLMFAQARIRSLESDNQKLASTVADLEAKVRDLTRRHAFFFSKLGTLSMGYSTPFYVDSVDSCEICMINL